MMTQALKGKSKQEAEQLFTEFHSMVTGELAIRYYAGVPLIVNSVAIGKLCVLDRQPRQLTPAQRESLNDLALLTTVILQARVDAFKTLTAVHSQY